MILIHEDIVLIKGDFVSKFCKSCGKIVTPRNTVKGSFFVEVILWLLFLLPGMIYSIWRSATKAKVCPSCGSKELIEASSPLARQLQNNIAKQMQEKLDVKKCPHCAETIKKGAKLCRFCNNEVPLKKC